MVTTRREILTILSTMGMIKNSPGPFAPTNRPNRKITPRSYSRTILIALIKKSTITATIKATVTLIQYLLKPGQSDHCQDNR